MCVREREKKKEGNSSWLLACILYIVKWCKFDYIRIYKILLSAYVVQCCSHKQNKWQREKVVKPWWKMFVCKTRNLNFNYIEQTDYMHASCNSTAYAYSCNLCERLNMYECRYNYSRIKIHIFGCKAQKQYNWAYHNPSGNYVNIKIWCEVKFLNLLIALILFWWARKWKLT